MQTFKFTRFVIFIWMTLLAMAFLAASSPAPIDPGTASVVASNLNLGCVNGCPAADSVQQPNSALSSATSPFSLIGALLVVAGVLAGL
ncbi:hypothetical protein F5I97DRAFT_2075732 [Phlebopus sp. FC_14]|nr:hypothetical protein F5I97DRAFT_2075732 [Phlebopus sp. FC_14]